LQTIANVESTILISIFYTDVKITMATVCGLKNCLGDESDKIKKREETEIGNCK